MHHDSDYVGGSTLNKKICGTDINMKLGVCALEGCKQCNVFTLTIGPMSFRLDGDSLNELVAMLRQCANSEQYEENLVESFSAHGLNSVGKH